MTKNIQVIKIIASSNQQGWAQAYHAGNITAIVTVVPKTSDDATSLHIVGKDLLNTFESEYFTLENKNLASIKQAVEATYQKSATTHTISFLVAAAIQNTLYVILAGNGSIFLLRKGKIGTLLQQEAPEPTIQSSSGFLEHGDIIVLTSPAFLKMIDKEKLFDILTQNPLAEAGEMLAPPIHASLHADAAAVLMQYEDETVGIRPHEIGIPKQEPEKQPSEQEKKNMFEEEQIPHPQRILPNESLVSPEPIRNQQLPSSPTQKNLTHRRKILLTVIVILIVVLGLTSYFAIKKQQEAKNAALFQATYPNAQQKYQEAVGIMDLNPPLARTDLTTAQQQLTTLNTQLSKGSSQQKQTADLLTKVQDSLTQATGADLVAVTKVVSSSPILTYATSHTSVTYITDDATDIYTADSTNVTQINQKTQDAKKIITNDNNWTTLGGFETYYGNFYLVDTRGSILKYTKSGSTYKSSDYLASGVSPDLSNAVSLAIDGSLWILGKDGTLLKFTKGKQDTFAISGLDKPLSSPSRIVTSIDDNNIYMLDNGNGRIVVADKTGKFIRAYANGLLKQATQLVVDEKNHTATFLSGNTTYQITLQ